MCKELLGLLHLKNGGSKRRQTGPQTWTWSESGPIQGQESSSPASVWPVWPVGLWLLLKRTKYPPSIQVFYDPSIRHTADHWSISSIHSPGLTPRVEAKHVRRDGRSVLRPADSENADATLLQIKRHTTPWRHILRHGEINDPEPSRCIYKKTRVQSQTGHYLKTTLE